MARVGFKKVYPAGSVFDAAATQTMLGHIKTHLASAGFNVLLDTPGAIDVIRAGFPSGTKDDDVPHWAFVYNELNPYNAGVTAYSVYGNDYLDANGNSNAGGNVVHSNNLDDHTKDTTVWFAADGAAGWWWLVGVCDDAASPSGKYIYFANAGVTTRRYPADQYSGLCARYGIWNKGGNWYPAYAKNADGTPNAAPTTNTWSPFGEGWSNNGQRHPGSPLPRMAVPQFPNRDGSITACVFGEFNEIMILTDGYAIGEEVVPGWIAFVGNQQDQPFAVPAPASFTLL